MVDPVRIRRAGRGAGALLGAVLTVFLGATVAAAATQPATWNFRQADVPAAQALGHDGAGVTVAVVDTWVDPTHPDFGGRVVDEAYCVGGNGSCRDHAYAPDACAHGTHVSGTVASSRFGAAPAARILAVQALSYDQSSGECSGSGTDIAAGIRFAAAHGAKVVNLSVGDLVPLVFQDSDITSAIRSVAAAGVVVVVAAGNQALPLTDSYGSDVLVVAATGPSGQLAAYSDYGGSVSLAAPGGDAGNGGCTQQDCVLSTIPHDRYGLLEGTSMAAPHVAGAAALLFAQSPRRGAADVVSTLERTAHPLSGAGHGLLDAAAALRLHAPRGSETTATAGHGATVPAATTGPRPSPATHPAPTSPAVPATASPSSAAARPQSAQPAAAGDAAHVGSPPTALSTRPGHRPDPGDHPDPAAVAVAATAVALTGTALLLARRGARPGRRRH